MKVVKQPFKPLIVPVHGLERFRLEKLLRRTPYWQGEIERLPDRYEKTRELEARTVNLKTWPLEWLNPLPIFPKKSPKPLAGLPIPRL